MSDHTISRAIVHLSGVKLIAVRCTCGQFETTGKRLSTADRRKAERLAAEHLEQAGAEHASA